MVGAPSTNYTLESHTLIGCGFFTFTLKGKETRRRRGEKEKGGGGKGTK
jgi:hypothetical protein